ncbi:MAG: type II toxin-antitoxin system death-on-curing family toxin [Ruminococcus flavefaciens]|nr:type II toxin-antitoxin system death-on-curing family toxin [Ruminococcus flavefaciens]MCM1362555.1 type II toxin-antitoxin system death-on-curing family toxin [Clostridiales bacterium]
MIQLTKQQVILLHKEIIAESGGSPEIRDEGLLDSALNAPFQTFSGTELYTTILEKAARLGYSLIKNHAFVDGNKRIGAHTMLVFLALNNIEVEYEDNDFTQLILGVAAGEISAEQLLAWLQSHVA